MPNTQFTWSLRAAHDWDAGQLCWRPRVDSWGELDQPGIFVAGDASGIGGANAAPVQGRLAALAAALTARYGSRPDVAASRALHVTTSLVSEKGAMDVMQALDAAGVRGSRVEAWNYC